MSWILNHSNEYERLNLKKKLRLKSLKHDDLNIMIYNSVIWDKCYIRDNIIYLINYNWIMDRNMLLMIKDTATARFHTLLSMETSHSSDYDYYMIMKDKKKHIN